MLLLKQIITNAPTEPLDYSQPDRITAFRSKLMLAESLDRRYSMWLLL